MSQLFSGKDNHLFVADAKYRVPTMQNRLGNLMRLFTKKSFYSQECSAELGGGRGWR